MTRSRALKIALPLAAALGAGTAVAIASIPSSSDGVIHACYSTTGTGTSAGVLRVIDADANPNCATGEATLTWNQTGPTGPQGPQGDPGLPGDTGGDTSGGGSFGGTDTGTPTQAGGPNADIFLKLDGVSGDSTDDKHKGEIDVEAVAYNDRLTGKRHVATIRIDKVSDSSSPKLLAASASGKHFKSATITFRLSGADADSAFETYKLSNVVVSSFEQGGANPDKKALGSLEEEVGLTAAKLQITERTPTNSGKDGPAVGASVDLGHLKH
jgi:type VI secretion system secreted protein Hcp